MTGRRPQKRTARQAATTPPAAGAGWITVKVLTAFTPFDLEAKGLVVAVWGDVPNEVGDEVTLCNTIQTYDGAIDDLCHADPRGDDTQMAGGLYGNRYEIKTKPCAPNTTNDPAIDLDPGGGGPIEV